MTGDVWTIDGLQDAYFVNGETLSQLHRDALQRWHEQQGHHRNPINGGCFCCCEECDPR